MWLKNNAFLFLGEEYYMYKIGVIVIIALIIAVVITIIKKLIQKNRSFDNDYSTTNQSKNEMRSQESSYEKRSDSYKSIDSAQNNWRCTCGAMNRDYETSCHRCGKSLSDLKKQSASNKEESANQSASTVADELKKYKEMLDQGLITQEDFDAKKKQLLGL